MLLKKAEWCEPWMTDDEKRIMKRQMAAMRKLFKTGGVPDSPFISMRAIDLGIHHLMVRRLEAKMGTGNATAVPVPTFADEPAVNIAQLVEQIGKTRERLRKAMRELEEVCVRLGKPVNIGFPDEMRSLMLATRHLLDSDIWRDDDSPEPESVHEKYDILDSAVLNGDIPAPDSPCNTLDISDNASRSGDIPVPESAPKTGDILDGTTCKSVSVRARPAPKTYDILNDATNNESDTTTNCIRYDM